MRIALVAPFLPVSIWPHIGGVQEFLKDLSDGLVQRGHRVTLFTRDEAFAPGIPIETLSFDDDPPPSPPAPGRLDFFFSQSYIYFNLFLQLQERRDEFDLLHLHVLNWHAVTYSMLVRDIPVLHTLHTPGTFFPYSQTALRVLHQHGHPSALSAVSQACARVLGVHAPIDHVIHNGVAVERIPFRSNVSPEAPLLCAGRICQAKGFEEAIEIAVRANRKLLLAGDIIDHRYYEERVVPRITQAEGQVIYLGFVERQTLWEAMGQSLGLLFPVCWEEPFGLVAVEAMAAGTPVIAFRRGAVEELIRHGETGFIVDPGDIRRAASCVDDLAGLSRMACRRHVESHFPLERMLDAYEQVYEQIVTAYCKQRENRSQL